MAGWDKSMAWKLIDEGISLMAWTVTVSATHHAEFLAGAAGACAAAGVRTASHLPGVRVAAKEAAYSSSMA
jgi:hypothetical protein